MGGQGSVPHILWRGGAAEYADTQWGETVYAGFLGRFTGWRQVAAVEMSVGCGL